MSRDVRPVGLVYQHLIDPYRRQPAFLVVDLDGFSTGRAAPVLSFLGAHGYDPGPTQRPVLACLLAGLLATLPASAILKEFGSLKREAEILDLSLGVTFVVSASAMALAGAAYGRLFQRAANDRRGGWMLGRL